MSLKSIISDIFGRKPLSAREQKIIGALGKVPAEYWRTTEYPEEWILGDVNHRIHTFRREGYTYAVGYARGDFVMDVLVGFLPCNYLTVLRGSERVVQIKRRPEIEALYNNISKKVETQISEREAV